MVGNSCAFRISLSARYFANSVLIQKYTSDKERKIYYNIWFNFLITDTNNRSLELKINAKIITETQ